MTNVDLHQTLFSYYYYQLISIRSCTKIPTLPTYITGKLDMAGMKSCLTRRHRLVWSKQSINLRSWILTLFKYLQEIVRSGQGPVKLFPCLQHEFTHIWNKKTILFEDNFLHYKFRHHYIDLSFQVMTIERIRVQVMTIRIRFHMCEWTCTR